MNTRSRLETVADHETVAELVALAQKTPGWNNRTCPPQLARLRGGCALYVVPAWLWRPRIGVQPRRPVGPPVPMRRAG